MGPQHSTSRMDLADNCIVCLGISFTTIKQLVRTCSWEGETNNIFKNMTIVMISNNLSSEINVSLYTMQYLVMVRNYYVCPHITDLHAT
jgi:hypothetical protein